MDKALKRQRGVFYEDDSEVAAVGFILLPVMLGVVIVWSCAFYVKAIMVLAGLVFAKLAGGPSQEPPPSDGNRAVARLQQRLRDEHNWTGVRSDV